MNTTVRMKASQIYKDWRVIDAAGRPLGRVATEAATFLRGKHKPTYEPHLDDGDFVIIINAAQVRVTGRKSEQIKYYRHSGYPGGLKTRSYEEQLAKFPERVLERAVWGMLPGGSLGEAIFKHLKVYRGMNHPHQSQVTGSERARATREALAAETAAVTRKPARLRPLGGVASVAATNAAASTTASLQSVQDEAVLSSETPAAPVPATVDGQTTIAYGTPTPAEAAVTAGAALGEATPRRRVSRPKPAAAAVEAPPPARRRATARKGPDGPATAAGVGPEKPGRTAKAATGTATPTAQAKAAPANVKPTVKAKAAPARAKPAAKAKAAPPGAKATAKAKAAPAGDEAAGEAKKPARRRAAPKQEE